MIKVIKSKEGGAMNSTALLEDVKFKPSEGLGKKVAIKGLERFHSSTLVWFLVNRHKFGLLATFTIVYVSLTMFHSLIFGLFQSLK